MLKLGDRAIGDTAICNCNFDPVVNLAREVLDAFVACHGNRIELRHMAVYSTPDSNDVDEAMHPRIPQCTSSQEHMSLEAHHQSPSPSSSQDGVPASLVA